MRILFVAPLPPPITGHALASQILLEGLRRTHDVEVVDLSRNSKHDGRVTLKRVLAVAKSLKRIRSKSDSSDLIYLTISESVAGNVKDLLAYALCMPMLSKVYIHLHGGSLRKLLFDEHRILLGLNSIFVPKLGGVIVSGQSHVGIFSGLIEPNRVHVVPNCAVDELFVPPYEVEAKFSATDPLRILYISGMTPLKGFKDLVDAFFLLPDRAKQCVQIDLAGRFDDERERVRFERDIIDVPQVRYHGVVDDPTKVELFRRAHVFCLPTAHLEGQPVSILEAYASGCVVVTTVPSGIRDIFTPAVHGFEVQARAPQSIRTVLEKLVAHPECMAQIARTNRDVAEEKYRVATYQMAVREILEASNANQAGAGPEAR